MPVLIDTSFLVAVALAADKNHAAAVELLRTTTEKQIIPEVVLPELFFVVGLRTHYAQAVTVLEALEASEVDRVYLTQTDLTRMTGIMRQYEDALLDFVDVALMALSERLAIETIYTFDHRDFSIFRPNHCDYLILRP